MSPHLVLRVVSKLLIPIIVVFGFYVHFHGDYSPGGGFQAGVIIASAVILYALIFGVEAARNAVPPLVVRIGAALGVLIYGGVGVATLIMGENYLDYDVLHPDQAHHTGQHIGILLVELGVLTTVFSVMLAIFYAFAGRAPDIPEEEW
ncbi:Na(+)/H(+) antiporter subunit B [Hyphobacterium marinum]|uniref:Na(+)/H(+) antiporter subunit B n=1 Tax=Hyphobacterium marinum TaxID=3116574 RepID=A0ABU7M0Y8_9PROT|nr:Na(+)/H(+) antiporter subunit B [Hyphobacterium sp. Y6023]MEE2567361.1 Na(+)/H(+) antiporter subunit B [Hyphobacterium sp. Y6023]